MVMPFGRSGASLESVSDYRASVVQRGRARSRVQRVVSTIIAGAASLPALAAIAARNRFQRKTRVVRRAGTCSQRM